MVITCATTWCYGTHTYSLPYTGVNGSGDKDNDEEEKDPEQHSIQKDIAAVMITGVLIVTLINDVDDAVVD